MGPSGLPHAASVDIVHIAFMSENVSVRLEDGLAQRSPRARAAGETLSDALRRYAEEGVRRDEHPMITFRDTVLPLAAAPGWLGTDVRWRCGSRPVRRARSGGHPCR